MPADTNERLLHCRTLQGHLNISDAKSDASSTFTAMNGAFQQCETSRGDSEFSLRSKGWLPI